MWRLMINYWLLWPGEGGRGGPGVGGSLHPSSLASLRGNFLGAAGCLVGVAGAGWKRGFLFPLSTAQSLPEESRRKSKRTYLAPSSVSTP